MLAVESLSCDVWPGGGSRVCGASEWWLFVCFGRLSGSLWCSQCSGGVFLALA